MAQFIDILAGLINDEIESCVIAQPNSVVRRLFLGPSYKILEQLLTKFEDSDGIHSNNGKTIPVLLANGGVEYGPGGNKPGKCSDEYLVGLRNRREASFVQLKPVDTDMCASLTTTISSFGIDKGTLEKSLSWADDPFITKLVDGLRNGIHVPDETWGKLKKVIIDSLKELENFASNDPEKEYLWELLRKLYDNLHLSSNPVKTVISLCGFPNIEGDDVDLKKHLKVLNR